MSLPTPNSDPHQTDSPPQSIPGTPTSTTTSLSALSTTAIKDGHRGSGPHHNNPSSNPRAIEAEQRADRIARLPGLSSISASRFPISASSRPGTAGTATSAPGVQGSNVAVAYFDASGTPVVLSKMSTVGSASATADEGFSVMSASSSGGLSATTMGTNADAAGLRGPGVDGMEIDDDDDDNDLGADQKYMEEEDMDIEEREGGDNDDGNESLVGFGEGAGSTLEGEVYSRRAALLGREMSGNSEDLQQQPQYHHQQQQQQQQQQKRGETGTPVSFSAMQERREARMVDGVSLDSSNGVFVDTTTRGPIPQQPVTSGIRETQQPGSHQHVLQHQRQVVQPGQGQQQQQQVTSPTAASSRETAERILRERFGTTTTAGSTVGIGTGQRGEQGERLGRFFFEER